MPPLAVAAGITAAATIGGSVLSASATKKAANKAADTSLQTAQMNNALTQQIYQQNTANMQPFMRNGLQASNALTGMLFGTPAAAPATAPAQGGYAAPAQYGAPVPANDGGLTPEDIIYRNGRFSTRDGMSLEAAEVREIYARQRAGQQPVNALQPAQAAAPAGTVPAAVNPWDQFRNSTNYQFRLNEGFKAANQGYAARGMLESGAAQKALLKYGQEFASNELGNYMGMLTNQQSMGLAGASALAGVGQNMVNNVTANNNSAGSAAANAQLMAGQANANMWGGIANGLGTLAGAFGTSYRR